MKPDLTPQYDVIIPAGPADIDIAALSIKNIFKYFSFGKIYVIASRQTFNKLKVNDKVQFIDEDSLIPGVQLNDIKNYCASLFNDKERGAWYFQQFLKMGISKNKEVAEYYLLWDADTIPLKRIKFFDQKGKVLFSYKTNEHHKPYFETLQKILGITKQVDFSFITEHMLIKKSVMQELVQFLSAASIEGKNWVEKILFAINKTEYRSGFSEYETYGNYIAKYYPDTIAFGKIKHKRSGSNITNKPGYLLLKILSFFKDTVSFEKGH